MFAYVADSKTHGRGVFASRNIKKEQKICYFDGDLLPLTSIDEQTNLDYAAPHHDNKNMIIGYSNPIHKSGIGQLINDSVCPVFVNENSYRDVSNALDEYESKSAKQKNVLKYLNSDWMYVTKDIEKGDELFVSYGKKYWMLHFMKKSQNSLLKLILFDLLYGVPKELTDDEAIKIISGVLMQNIHSEYWQKRLIEMKPKDIILSLLDFTKNN